MTYIIRLDGTNVGEFQEKDYGKFFTYRKTSNPWALSNGLEHEIDVLDGVRFADVKATVAYVCIDEDLEGNALLERWEIKKHKKF